MKPNEIKELIHNSGLYCWQVAKALNISESTFCRWLRVPVPPEKAREILKAVKNLKGA